MPRPPQERVRIVRCAPDLSEDARAPAFWSEWLARQWDAAEPLSEKPAASVRALLPPPAIQHAARSAPSLVAKVEPIDSPRRTLQALARATPLERHWRGAIALHNAGIRTARPLALLRGMTHEPTPRRVECLVMERLPGETLLEHLDQRLDHLAEWSPRPPRTGSIALSQGERARLARAVARLVFRLHARGLVNRDPKPSNLIVLDPRVPSPEIAVIDCVGVRPARPWERSARARLARLVRTLASLVIEPIGTMCPPARTDRMRTLRELARLLAAEGLPAPPPHVLWRRVDALVRAHHDPRPLHDPLPQPPAPHRGPPEGGDARAPRV